jgi:hypothetical protein
MGSRDDPLGIAVFAEQLLPGARQISAAIAIIEDWPVVRDEVVGGKFYGPGSAVSLAKFFGSLQDRRIVWYLHSGAPRLHVNHMGMERMARHPANL